jgi:hypothetical protein
MFWPGGVTFTWRGNKGNIFEEPHAICAVVLFGYYTLSCRQLVNAEGTRAIQREERLR